MRMSRFEWLSQFFRPRICAPKPKREKHEKKKPIVWVFTGPTGKAIVEAHTKSEARARIKKILGLEHLPTGMPIEPLEPLKEKAAA